MLSPNNPAFAGGPQFPGRFVQRAEEDLYAILALVGWKRREPQTGQKLRPR
jgi:hypothetical protein